MTQTTTTDTMSDAERYYYLLEIKDKKIKQQQIAIGFLVLIIVISSLVGIYAAYLIKPIVNESKTDSLTFANKALEVQLGYALAEAQTQATRAVKAENKARERDTIYISRVKYIKTSAPDTCQPYLTAMQNECDTLVLMHVNSEMSKDTLIEKQNGVIAIALEKDSVSQLVISEQREDLKKSAKQIQRERNGKRAAIGFGVLMLVVYVISGVMN